MHIGLAVEEHDHGYVWDAVVAVIQTQIHRHRHCAHRAELEIEDGEVGYATTNCLGYITSVAANGERRFGGPERRHHLIKNPLGIGAEQDVHA